MSAAAHHRRTYAPSGTGTVVLSIGGDFGALIIHAPARLHGHEIGVSPAGEPAARTHAAVRARYVRGGVTWSAVLDRLRAGRYVVWRDPVTPLAEVDVPGGGVAEYRWPERLD
jgi:hypothetical protein